MKCRFCSGDASEPNHPTRCCGQQGALEFEAEARPFVADAFRQDPVTRSTGEAFDLLKRTRKWLITEARQIARELIRREGTTHVRAVLAEMQRRGLLDGIALPDHWLGPVFATREFAWTGTWATSEATSGINETRGKRENVHAGRAVKVWRFRLPTDAIIHARPPKPERDGGAEGVA